jgi:hypothetical protein
MIGVSGGEQVMRIPVLATSAFLVGSALSLAACLGGGGSSGGTAVAVVGGNKPVPFTTWDDVAPLRPVEIPGEGQESSYTYDVVAEKVTALEDFSDGAVVETVRYDFNQVPLSLAIETPQTSVAWGEDDVSGDQFGNLGAFGLPEIDAAISDDQTEIALTSNPFISGWNYQTFGVWVTGSGTSSGRIGTFSVGSITPNSQVPNMGMATYLGGLGGAYVAPDGTDFLTTADLQVDANFVTNALNFQSSNTQLTRDLQTFTPDNTLNLDGTLTWSGGSSEFGGPLSNQSGSLSGEASGSFYGPSAEELGGNFLLTNGGSSLETYVGSFGAVRGPIN